MSAGSKAFPAAHRLSGRLRFAAVYDARVKVTAGPLAGYSLPNDLDNDRLGLSVSRHVGNAVRRNRIKRLVREAFRLRDDSLKSTYDFVIVVRLHELGSLTDYQKWLAKLILNSHAAWKRKTAAE